MTFSLDGERLYYVVGASQCELRALGVQSRDDQLIRTLSFCPQRLMPLDDGSLLVAGAHESQWLDVQGGIRFEGRTVLSAIDGEHYVELTDEGLLWVNGDTSLVLDSSTLRETRIARDGTLLAVHSDEQGERIVRFDGPAPSAITPSFDSIDSWDLAPRSDELVFSAKRDTSFDVGIVSTTGGEVNWIAPEPSDEKTVSWAPRGNKVTYTFESLDASLVRTVHVPTSFQVIFDLPLTSVRGIAWEPRAERFAMAIESPTMGARIDWIGYQGEDRAGLVEARERVEAPVEAAFWPGGSGVLLGPETIRYGQTLPTIVWVEDQDPFGWHPEVARLREAGLPVLVTTPERSGDLRAALEELPWFSPGRLYVVDATGRADGATQSLVDSVRMDGGDMPGGEIVVMSGRDGHLRSKAVRIILDREGQER